MHLTRISIAALAVVLAGCGGDGDGRLSGVDAENYRTAYVICGQFPPSKVAGDLGVTTSDPEIAAQTYANDLEPDYRESAHDGCLDAFLDKPSRVEG